MPKSSNQKLKLLYLKKALVENTDENHLMSMAQIIDYLEQNGISAERKSIYDDLEALKLSGLDIIQTKAKGSGYYLASREFELPEVKLLVDSVQSSKYISHNKTLTLIKKIEGLVSVHEGKLLNRQVYVQNRVKTMNESVYYNVDEISAGIEKNKKICFKYFEYNIKKEREYRHDGSFYIVSPFAFVCEGNNYYLRAYDSTAGIMKHYRVDKMTNISVMDQDREGADIFNKTDMSTYTEGVFGMYGGEAQSVTLKFNNKLIGVVIDRFGKDISIKRVGDEEFTITVEVQVSPQFFGWLFAFGTDAQIVSPKEVGEKMKQNLLDLQKLYIEQINILYTK